MPALFPRWTNAAARGSLLALAAIGIGVPLALMVWVRSSFATGEHATIVQPVAFDHRVHAHALRIDCTYCHATATTAASAGLPPTAACVGCHNKTIMASVTLAPVRASLATHIPIAWQRVNALPDFVFFNHSIHVAKGVGCETCHGRVDQMAQVSQATPLSMAWCLSCHRDPAPNLRPRTEITTMGWAANHNRSDSSAAGERFMQEYGVVRRTTCSTCHR
jgi:Cytochrome c7 and related cytochrome c